MSEFCLVDLTDNPYDFKKLDKLAKKLIRISLKNNIAVFFNSYDYGVEIIQDAKLKTFFLLSDSFLYKNCGFLDMTWLNFELDSNGMKELFIKKFNFFNEILEVVFNYGYLNVQIYISEDGAVNSEKDFLVRTTTKDNFLTSLFESVFEYSDKYSYEFPTIKFRILRD